MRSVLRAAPFAHFSHKVLIQRVKPCRNISASPTAYRLAVGRHLRRQLQWQRLPPVCSMPSASQGSSSLDHAAVSPSDPTESSGSGAGGGSTIHVRTTSNPDDEQPIGVHMNPVALVLLAYASFLGWIALCAAGLDQYLDKHIHTLPGANNWDVSIIIPVLNDEEVLGGTITWLRDHLEGDSRLEIIVVDGGSEDKTMRVAWDAGASRVVRASRKGRAAQMNAGASHATGDILVFLHAESRPPKELVPVLRDELSDPRTVLLGFKCTLEGSNGSPLRLLTAHQQLKTWFYPLLLRPMDYLTGLRLLLGDQILCCRKKDFQAVGGYNANLPVMEDADLCRRLHDHGPAPKTVHTRHTKLAVKGRIHGRIKEITDHECVTNGRRLEPLGPIYGTYVHAHIAWAWLLGANGEELGRLCDRLHANVYR